MGSNVQSLGSPALQLRGCYAPGLLTHGVAEQVAVRRPGLTRGSEASSSGRRCLHMLSGVRGQFLGQTTPGSLPSSCAAEGLPAISGGEGVAQRRGLTVEAKIRKNKRAAKDPSYPWPAKFGEESGFLSFLSKFKPRGEEKRSVNVTLPFEKEMVELQKRVEEVKALGKKTGMDFTAQIAEAEARYNELKKKIYSQLSPVQRLSVARHPNRPTFLDHVINITDKWVELHGDRGGFDDPALVCGLGMIDGMSFMLMGHQKGRNTKENIHRNFGMPTPNGYRKALRLMRHAAHHGFPILTFIDTPGAYAGVSAEELGQGEAIAHNLREMFGLPVPVITTVIGEGGSGGALAIGCCDRMLMLENAVYYVASPEACAAILWKTSNAAPQATAALRITGKELQKLNVVDEVIKEPLGGAHTDPMKTSQNIKEAISRHMKELLALDRETLLRNRVAKFRAIGGYKSGEPVPEIKRRSMKPADTPTAMLPPRAMPSALVALESKLAAKAAPRPEKVNATASLAE